jgi:hypothetical protein
VDERAGGRFSENVREIVRVLRAYAMQELVDPIRGLGVYLAFGIGGAALAAIGSGLLLLGVLRCTQFEAPDKLDAIGRSSVVPYLIVVLLGAVTMALLVRRIPREFGGGR